MKKYEIVQTELLSGSRFVFIITALFWFVFQYGLAPTFEPILMMGSAKLAAFYRGASLVFVENYWVLPLASFDLRITTACSGVSFYGMLCTLGLWLYLSEKRYRYGFASIVLLPFVAFALTVVLNAIRIHLAAELYFWLQPLLSGGWQMRAHLLLGILLFLPALTFWFIFLAKKWTAHE